MDAVLSASAEFPREAGLVVMRNSVSCDMKTGYVHIMANASRTIHVGITSDLERRVWEYKTHLREGLRSNQFTRTQRITSLSTVVPNLLSTRRYSGGVSL